MSDLDLSDAEESPISEVYEGAFLSLIIESC